MAGSKRLYRLLLKLYPARFHEEFGRPLEQQFVDEYGEHEGAGARTRFWIRTLADLACSIPAELLRELGQDLRYAARVYRRRSLVTILALSALALAIGVTTGVFSVVNALLIRSLPFREPERLVQVMSAPVSPLSGRAGFYAWANSGEYLASAAGYFPTQMNLGLADQSLRVPVAEVSANFFALLGSDAAFGRTFTPDEDRAGFDSVAVIGHGLWQQFFGGDPRVLGATIYLNGTRMTVIGVAPATLDFPSKTAVWTPTLFDFQHLPKQGVFYGDTIGRLKDGLSVIQAGAMFEADALRRNGPPGREIDRAHLVPLQDKLAGPIRQASFVLLGLVGFVLLIACANVAHLLLARVAERCPELAIRGALGASRGRLVQQLITESTLLTLVAAGAGLGVAQWASRLAAAAQPAQLAAQNYSVLDWRVLGFAVGLAALTGILFGVLPALLMGRMQVAQDPTRARSAGQPSGAGRMRVVLLAMQAALTLVLVAGSLIMGRSFLRLAATDLGFRTANVVTLNVSLAGTRWDVDKRTTQYYDEALDRLRAIAGVESAAAVGYLPLMDHSYMAATLELDSTHKVHAALYNFASPDYFRTMGTRLIEGREFTAADRSGAERVVIVNQEFAAQLGIGARVAGKKVTARWTNSSRSYEIVGVVQSALFRGPGVPARAEIYQATEQSPPAFVTFVARVRGAMEPYLVVCRDAVQQVDAQVPVFDVKTLDSRLQDLLARPRFYTTAVLFFGGFALLLAVVGIYGVASYSIAQRTHEIGVRIAIGASPGGLRGMLLWQSLLPLGCGVLVGIAGAAVLGRYLQHLIAGAETTGPWTCSAAAATLVAAAAIAVWTATHRIVRLDTTAALRAE